jgi:hypothetical protein
MRLITSMILILSMFSCTRLDNPIKSDNKSIDEVFADVSELDEIIKEIKNWRKQHKLMPVVISHIYNIPVPTRAEAEKLGDELWTEHNINWDVRIGDNDNFILIVYPDGIGDIDVPPNN